MCFWRKYRGVLIMTSLVLCTGKVHFQDFHEKSLNRVFSIIDDFREQNPHFPKKIKNFSEIILFYFIFSWASLFLGFTLLEKNCQSPSCKFWKCYFKIAVTWKYLLRSPFRDIFLLLRIEISEILKFWENHFHLIFWYLRLNMFENS